MSELEIKIIQEKIEKGLEWSYEKMLREKASRNEKLVILKNDRIEKVAASELLKEENKKD